VIGGDGGGLDDLARRWRIGREKKTRHWLCWNHAWAHRQVLEIRKDIAQRCWISSRKERSRSAT
jgi:phage terminase large subunit-like protein